MDATEVRRAVAAARSTASELGLPADDVIVLNDSNRLVVRLMPCDVVARVTPMGYFASAEHEVELVRRLAETDSPVGPLDPRVEPRVFARDGFEIALWAHIETVPSGVLRPAEYAQALARLHAGLRRIEIRTPHVMDRVAATRRDVDGAVTPDLTDSDRSLLADALRDLGRSIVDRRAPEQVLHGEPHPANVLATKDGPLFVDFENTARGPIEYDLAWVSREVGDRYRDADQELIDDCRGLVLAIVAMHRWSRGDRHPSGRESGVAFVGVLRDGPPWPALDEVAW